MNTSHKITIQLTEEQMANYQFSTETLWFDEEGPYYKLKNIPLFVDELSYDDLVSIEKVDENEYIIEKIIQKSGNSTIWLFFKNNDVSEKIIEAIHALGCGIEGGTIDGYYGINILTTTDIDDVYSLIDKGEQTGDLVADYPSIRH